MHMNVTSKHYYTHTWESKNYISTHTQAMSCPQTHSSAHVNMHTWSAMKRLSSEFVNPNHINKYALFTKKVIILQC